MRVALLGATVALLYLTSSCKTTGADSNDVKSQGGSLQESIYVSAARGVIGCYEAVGESFPREFDETGDCGNAESIWLRESTNPSVEITQRLIRDEGDDVTWRRVSVGTVKFKEGPRVSCGFNMKLYSSDEDAVVEVRNFACAEDGGGEWWRDLFKKTASGIVACHEALGDAFPREFDESGECGPTLSIWTMSSTNGSIQTQSRVVRNDVRGATFRRVFKGSVTFVDRNGRSCKFKLTVESTDEDGGAEVRNFRCR